MREKSKVQLSKHPLGKSADVFFIMLAGAAVGASGGLFYLLNRGNLDLGYEVVLAGVGGIIGACLSPLLLQQSERDPILQQSERDPKELTGQAKLAPITRLIVYIAGGFGFTAAAFVVTSALLLNTPGETTSTLGTAAFGGGVGFFIGREINRMLFRQPSEEGGLSPAIVTALGDFEDQFFGQRLLNYDGYAVANWYASGTSSEALGKIRVHMQTHETHSEPEESGGPPSEVATEEPKPLSSTQARVLVQGGQDADHSVPFAISVVSGAFDVQPQRLILAAPPEGKSETLEFTVLNPQPTEDGESAVPEDDEINSTEAASHLGSQPSTAAALIDVSQGGKTVQLFEVEISQT
jgi:hypothetical protein